MSGRDSTSRQGVYRPRAPSFGSSSRFMAGTVALIVVFRRRIGRMDGRALIRSYSLIIVASAVAAGVAAAVWYGLDQLLGRDLFAQVITVGSGLAAAVVVYLLCARLLRIPELRMLLSLRRRSGTTGE